MGIYADPSSAVQWCNMGKKYSPSLPLRSQVQRCSIPLPLGDLPFLYLLNIIFRPFNMPFSIFNSYFCHKKKENHYTKLADNRYMYFSCIEFFFFFLYEHQLLIVQAVKRDVHTKGVSCPKKLSSRHSLSCLADNGSGMLSARRECECLYSI